MTNIKFLNENAMNLSVESSSVDLIITAPPWLGIDPFRYGGDPEKQINFVDSEKEYVSKLIKATEEFKRVLKDNGTLIINLNAPISYRYYAEVVDKKLLNYEYTILWDFSEEFEGRDQEISNAGHQTWLIFCKGDKFYENQIFLKKFPWRIIRRPFNNVHLKKEQLLSQHGFILDAYSIEIVEYFIKTYSPPKSVILDPFGGSGVAAVTAYLNNRKGITNDVSEDAVNLAKKRFEIYTGNSWDENQ
jgi:DNA modification methylase